MTPRFAFLFPPKRERTMKKITLFSTSLLVLTLLAAGPPDAGSQQTSPKTVSIPVKFRYSVSFVCGQAQEPKPCVEFRDIQGRTSWLCPESSVPAGANGAPVVRGLYATAVNVHNPALPRGTNDGTVIFAKKVAVALPWQKSGPVSRFQRAVLKSNHAFEIDCEEIAAMYLNSVPGGTSAPPPFPVFLKGFVVVMSPVELDVTAVYSSRQLGGGGSTVDVEVIEARNQEAVVQAYLPADKGAD